MMYDEDIENYYDNEVNVVNIRFVINRTKLWQWTTFGLTDLL